MGRAAQRRWRAKWDELTEEERDLVCLRGLRNSWAVKALGDDKSGQAKGAKRNLEAIDRAIARLAPDIAKAEGL